MLEAFVVPGEMAIPAKAQTTSVVPCRVLCATAGCRERGRWGRTGRGARRRRPTPWRSPARSPCACPGAQWRPPEAGRWGAGLSAAVCVPDGCEIGKWLPSWHCTISTISELRGLPFCYRSASFCAFR
jgi:hypothetical protein